ncbi:hypothetical protein ABZZ74_45085 [Streptomyces sp. NPDC006476]|uniref:hypothetical protein n=1 Tax=Streptomyces sp. NPDC006476 TaxID=3157175 RepID=UPI0033A55266
MQYRSSSTMRVTQRVGAFGLVLLGVLSLPAVLLPPVLARLRSPGPCGCSGDILAPLGDY